MVKATPSNKRKAVALVPDSFTSFLMGALHDNFHHLKAHIQQDCAFVTAKADSGRFTKQLIEELFRYLFLLADSSSDGVIRSSPSYFVDQAFHCLMLDPVLYFNICDEVLNLLSKDVDIVKMRVLPHDALGGKGDDEGPRRARYTNTLTQYKQTFGEDPPLVIWSDYSNDPVAIQAELEAQQAEVAVSLAKSNCASEPLPPLRAVDSSAVSTNPPEPIQRVASSIELRFTGWSGSGITMSVKCGHRFPAILDQLCSHQKHTKQLVELKHKGMILRNYMTPYNLNMKDGDVIECNIPIYSPEELAAHQNKSDSSATSLGQGVKTAAHSASTTVVATASAPASASTTTTTTASTTASATSSITTSTDTTTSASTTTVSPIAAAPSTSPATTLPVSPAGSAAVSSGAIDSSTTHSNDATTNACTTECLKLRTPPATSLPLVDLTTDHASPTVSFRVCDQDSVEMQVTMNRTGMMKQVFRAFSDYRGVEEVKMKPMVDGVNALADDTPDTLGLQDGDLLYMGCQLLGC